ncbi:MAG: DsbA family protein [Alphaproteobacteria bacterium]|nr:DsbA family protein [Alphaproteobacteria bacterium]
MNAKNTNTASCDGSSGGKCKLMVAGLVIAALALGYAAGSGKLGGSAGGGDINAAIAQFIKDNPQALVDSLNSYQQKEQDEQLTNATESIKRLHKEIFEDEGSPVAGNPDGDVTLVEFFDYHCGYCKRSLPVISQLIDEDKNLRVVFKEFPILSPSSTLAAQYALAVHKVAPTQYFAFHSATMQSTGNLDEAELLKRAKDLGVDEQKLKDALKDADKELAKVRQLTGSLNVRGTPAFIVGDALIPGAVDAETLKKQIALTRSGK